MFYLLYLWFCSTKIISQDRAFPDFESRNVLLVSYKRLVQWYLFILERSVPAWRCLNKVFRFHISNKKVFRNGKTKKPMQLKLTKTIEKNGDAAILK